MRAKEVYSDVVSREEANSGRPDAEITYRVPELFFDDLAAAGVFGDNHDEPAATLPRQWGCLGVVEVPAEGVPA